MLNQCHLSATLLKLRCRISIAFTNQLIDVLRAISENTARKGKSAFYVHRAKFKRTIDATGSSADHRAVLAGARSSKSLVEYPTT